MDYLSNDQETINEMLAACGLSREEELFSDIPEQARVKGSLNVPEGLSELEVDRLMNGLAAKNQLPEISYLGAGCYNHYIPAAVSSIVNRSEFLTAYTPYQPEISQGLLQGIFEFQTMVSNLTGMDAANASLYDGATALAEAAVMAVMISRKDGLLISETVHPEYRKTVETYCRARNLNLQTIPMDAHTGKTDTGALRSMVNKDIAAVLVQSPNYLGQIEDLQEIGSITHEAKSLFIPCFTEALSLALLKPHGEFDADIVVGEGQSLGIPMAYGGPLLGIMACKQKYLRKLPGRIVGMAQDSKGREGFVLTLQAREQHIRREKASSSICSNQALCALSATVYMAAMGKTGLQHMAKLNYNRAHYAAKILGEIPGIKLKYTGPFFNEFVLQCEDAAQVQRKMKDRGIAGGVSLESSYPALKNCLLFCVTEMISKEDMDRTTEVL